MQESKRIRAYSGWRNLTPVETTVGNDSESIRSLARGLEVLRILQSRAGATLHELHVALGLPKPSLLRILATLEASGFAWQALGEKRYHASHRGTGPDAGDPLAEVAGPVLDWLMGQVRWPSDLSVRRGVHMQLRESSRLRSNFDLHRLRIGFKINMLLSAPGRAYLAYCTKPDREALLMRLSNASDIGYQTMGTATAIDRTIDETRQRGYAIRDPRWGGHPTLAKAQADDGLAAIAVPILAREKVLGCVNIVWISRVAKPTDVVRLHLIDLREAARLIGQRYEAERYSGHTVGSRRATLRTQEAAGDLP